MGSISLNEDYKPTYNQMVALHKFVKINKVYSRLLRRVPIYVPNETTIGGVPPEVINYQILVY